MPARGLSPTLEADHEFDATNNSIIFPSELTENPCSHNKGHAGEEREGPLTPQDGGPFGSATLCAFGTLLALTMATLIVVAAMSEAKNGLVNAHDKLSYAWRFGPTACKALRPTHSSLTLLTTALDSLHHRRRFMVSGRKAGSSI
jgi:hypothetical protein